MLLEGQPSLMHTHHCGKHNIYHTLLLQVVHVPNQAKLLLGAVVVGPHAKIDLLAPGLILIIYLAMCGGDILTC